LAQQDTNKILKEMSDLTRNMDGLFRELKESNANTKKITDSVSDVVKGITERDDNSKKETEKLFEGFSESFMKSIEDKNSDIISTLTKSLGDSVSEFANSIPGQIASVKSNVPIDYGSLLGGDSVKGIISGVASKIPGLKSGGIFKKKGLAVVGEDGPELASFDEGDQIISKEKLESVVSGGNSSLDSLTQQISDAEKSRDERQASIEEAIIAGANRDTERESQIPLAKQATKLISDDSLRSEFLSYAREELERADREELANDEDSFMDEFNYWKDQVKDASYFTPEEMKNFELYGTMYPKNTEDIGAEKSSEVSSDVMGPKPGLLERMFSKKVGSDEQDLERSTPNSEVSSVTEVIKSRVDTASENTSETPGGTVESAPSSVTTLKKEMPEPAESQGESMKTPDSLKVSEISSLTERLKAKLAEKEGKSSKPQSDASAAKPASSPADTGSTVTTTSRDSKETPKSAVSDLKEALSSISPQDQTKDLNDIKSLLANIYSVLKGPMSASRDQPYRPHSNQF